MMNDSDIDLIYKSGLPLSHAAGLRAVFDCGYAAALSVSPAAESDVSITVTPPAVDPTITVV